MIIVKCTYLFIILIIVVNERSQFYRFKDGYIPKAIDYFVNGRYFIVFHIDSLH